MGSSLQNSMEDKFFTQLSASILTVDWSKFDNPSEIANGNADIELSLNRN